MSKLIVGPWTHSLGESRRTGEIDFGEDSMSDIGGLSGTVRVLQWVQAMCFLPFLDLARSNLRMHRPARCLSSLKPAFVALDGPAGSGVSTGQRLLCIQISRVEYGQEPVNGGGQACQAIRWHPVGVTNTAFRDVKAASDEFARRTAEAHARFFLPMLRPEMRLLDCGCGPGTISVGLATAIAPGQLVGIDLDGEHIEQARRLAEELGVSSARFEIGNVDQIPYEDQSFDAVFCHAVLEHLDKPEAALAEMRRVLKPHGVIGVRTPDHSGNLLWPEDRVVRESLEGFIRLIASGGGDISRGKQLREQLVHAGFVDIRMTASYDSYGTPEAVRAWAEPTRRRTRTRRSLSG